MWLLLHFSEVSSASPIQRADIYSNLETAIQSFEIHKLYTYKHGKTEVIDALIELGNEAKAIERAENLLAEQKGKQSIDANPSTKVYLLVKRLRELIEYYSDSPD